MHSWSLFLAKCTIHGAILLLFVVDAGQASFDVFISTEERTCPMPVE